MLSQQYPEQYRPQQNGSQAGLPPGPGSFGQEPMKYPGQGSPGGPPAGYPPPGPPQANNMNSAPRGTGAPMGGNMMPPPGVHPSQPRPAGFPPTSQPQPGLQQPQQPLQQPPTSQQQQQPQQLQQQPQLPPQPPQSQLPPPQQASQLPPQQPGKPIQSQQQYLPGQGQGQYPQQYPPGIGPPVSQSQYTPPNQSPMSPSQQFPPQSYPPQQGQQGPPRPGQMPPTLPPKAGQPPAPPPGGFQAPPPQSGYPQQQRPPQGYPQPPGPAGVHANQGYPQQPPMPGLTNQMSNMNLNGMPRQPAPPSAYPGPQQGYPNAQMVNGIPEPSGPGRPMAPRYPENNLGAFPGQPPQPGGYPFPAAQPSTPGSPTVPGYPQGQPNQQAMRRLDPEQMPSPMQVMQDNQKTRNGTFYTNQKGQVPPLVTTNFVVQDQGNASPRFMRSTMYSVPINSDIMKQTAVPFGLVISPMADIAEGEVPPPVVDMGELGPVRCIRCKAYMCPFMQFIDGGRRFHCLLCKATTEVPSEYFQHLDHTGYRLDRYERPELVLGAYEFLATKEYCKDKQFPQPPAIIFVIDVSYNNIKSGLVSLLCAQMKQFLQNLPREEGQDKSPLRVGFITYNSSVHFYNVHPNLGQPQMMVVGDIHDMFMPLLDGFLVDPVESETVIDILMQQIPTMFAETKETEIILAPAIQAGLEALKAAGCAGKLFVFHSSLPVKEAPGKLKNRDDRKVLGTEKEKTVLTPQNNVYNNLGQECVGAGCSVDLFIFNNSYIDLATIGQVSRLSGGDIFKYTYFQADLDGDRVVQDVEKSLSRLCAFDAIMRVRTSTGVRPTEFYGHFFMSNTTDIELASIDPDKAIAVEVKHDDKLSEEEGVYIQTALLYTSINGQRKIRVLNLSLKACSQMDELYRACELDALINFFSKQAIYRLHDTPPKTIKDGLISRSAQILACYRKNCAMPAPSGQLILPECMKLLPLYANCVLKSDALSGGSDMTVDDRWFTMAAVTMMDISSSVTYFYPRLLSLHNMEDDCPIPVRCSSEKLTDDGVFLLENGIYMFLWLGLAVQQEWVMAVFGVPTVSQVNAESNRIPVLNNPLNEQIRNIISLISNSHSRALRLTLVRQRDKMEIVMKHFLVEDRGVDGSLSYVDFLCHMHKEIRTILS